VLSLPHLLGMLVYVCVCLWYFIMCVCDLLCIQTMSTCAVTASRAMYVSVYVCAFGITSFAYVSDLHDFSAFWRFVCIHAHFLLFVSVVTWYFTGKKKPGDWNYEDTSGTFEPLIIRITPAGHATQLVPSFRSVFDTCTCVCLYIYIYIYIYTHTKCLRICVYVCVWGGHI
jgi:hypothetical protein